MGELKRELGAGDSPAGKRSRTDEEGGDMVIKVLVPTSVAGAIIGKGGDTLRQLQASTGARLKMSKNNENYPETTERVAQIQGSISAVVDALKFIHERVGQKLDRNTQPDPYDFKNTDRAREMKLVVPASSAGMVIGKAGSFIKEMKEKASAQIQIYPKQGTAAASATPERVITLVGEPAQLEAALLMALPKIAADPNHSSQPHIAYGGQMPMGGGGGGGGGGGDGVNQMPLGGRGGNFDMGGMPMGMGFGGGGGGGFGPPGGGFMDGGNMNMGGGGGMGPPQHPQHQQGFGNLNELRGSVGMAEAQWRMGGGGGGGGGGLRDQPPAPLGQQHFPGDKPAPLFGDARGGGMERGGGGSGGGGLGDRPGNGSGAPTLPAKFNPMEGLSNLDVLNFLDSLQSTLRSSGFTESQIGEIMPAMQVLAKYNIMGLGLGLGVAAMATMRSGAKLPAPEPQEPAYGMEQRQSGMGGGDLDMGSMGNRWGGVEERGRAMDSLMSGGGGGFGGAREVGGGRDSGANYAASVIRTRQTADPSKMELEVPEGAVGAILGPKGQTLGEIKRYSGAHVEILKNRLPGGYRPVLISGMDQEAIRAGRVMVERAINEEFARRQGGARNY